MLQAWMYHWVDEDFPGQEDRWSSRLLHGLTALPFPRCFGGPYPPSHLYGTMSIWPKCARAVFEFGASDWCPLGWVQIGSRFFIYKIFTSWVLVALTMLIWAVLTVFWAGVVEREWLAVRHKAVMARLMHSQMRHATVMNADIVVGS